MITVTNYQPNRGNGKFGHGVSHTESEVTGAITRISHTHSADEMQEPLLFVKIQRETGDRNHRSSALQIDLDDASELYHALRIFLTVNGVDLDYPLDLPSEQHGALTNWKQGLDA